MTHEDVMFTLQPTKKYLLLCSFMALLDLEYLLCSRNRKNASFLNYFDSVVSDIIQVKLQF